MSRDEEKKKKKQLGIILPSGDIGDQLRINSG